MLPQGFAGPLHVFLSGVALTGALLTTPPSVARAAPALRVQTTQHGDFLMVGNTLGHECAAGTPAPVVGTVGACGMSGNDSAPDIFWRADAPAAGQAQANSSITSAQARSTAVLTIPAGARVTHAYAYWAATLPSGADSSATLERPGGFSAPLTALQTWTGPNNSYQAVVDVTALVQANGSGAYRMSGVEVQSFADVNNSNLFAGWWMVVLYELASEPLRTLAISDGLDAVTNGSPQNVMLTGFVVPNSGFTGRLGVATFEGDHTITGDQLFFNGGAALSDAQNPSDNFFNSTRSSLGLPVSVLGDLPQLTGTGGSLSGVDLDIVDVTSRLTAGLTSVPVQASSTGDVFYLAGFVTSIATFAPDYGTSTKTALDVNGGDVVAGDEIVYTLSFSNTGNDASIDTVVTDTLPLGVSFVPGSIRVLTGDNVGIKTDAAADDQAEYDAASRTVRVRLGAGANGLTGGSVSVGGASSISFRVRVDAGTRGVVANQGRVVGNGVLGSGSFESVTDGNTMLAGAQTTDILVEGCLTDADCAAPTPRCDTSPTPNLCVECLTNADCGALEPTCTASLCTCVVSGVEVCDGRDNDCNGSIDEGDPGGSMSCTSALAGICAAGTTRCTAGAIACVPNIAAGAMAEACDGLDNDCDAAVDNGDPGGGAPCATGLMGACSMGQTMCSSAAIACIPSLLPGTRAETCNAVDDDCNGMVDEDFTVGSECSEGLGACTSMGVIACTPEGTARCNAVAGAPSTEVCGNDIDEDCDGMNLVCGVDAGPMPDAGSDAGARDAGAADAGFAAGDAGFRGDTGVISGFAGGACGCRAVGSGDARWSTLALSLLGLVLVRRRRR